MKRCKIFLQDVLGAKCKVSVTVSALKSRIHMKHMPYFLAYVSKLAFWSSFAFAIARARGSFESCERKRSNAWICDGVDIFNTYSRPWLLVRQDVSLTETFDI